MSERVSVVAIAVALHLAVFTAWLLQPPSEPVPEHEMEVTVAMLAAPVVQAEIPPVQPPPRIVPVRQPPRIEKTAPAPLPVESVEQQSSDTTPVVSSEPPPVAAAEAVVVIAPVASVAQAVVSSAPATPDVEPDYKASYLNNRLTYPLAARRMGLQGRVMLNVEVLAEGLCGQVNVRQSSGHEILDNSAMQSVKTWKFAPARHAGDAITKWFMVPIQFSLKDNET